MNTVAGQRAEVLPAISQCRLRMAQGTESLEHAIEGMPAIKRIRLAPQRFAHRQVRIAGAMQRLFSAVIKARDTLQREQATHTHRELIRESIWRVGRAEVEALALVVIVQERHKESAGLPVRTQNIAFDLFAMLVHLDDFRGRDQSFRHAGQPEKQWEVQGGIHSNQISFLGGMPADEPCDLFLVIVHLAERKKVLLPDAEREFTHRVTEDLRELRLNELQRIDANPTKADLA